MSAAPPGKAATRKRKASPPPPLPDYCGNRHLCRLIREGIAFLLDEAESGIGDLLVNAQDIRDAAQELLDAEQRVADELAARS